MLSSKVGQRPTFSRYSNESLSQHMMQRRVASLCPGKRVYDHLCSALLDALVHNTISPYSRSSLADPSLPRIVLVHNTV
jgi:hypothetical protein